MVKSTKTAASSMEKKLGDILVKDSIISKEDLDLAVRKKEETGASLGSLLVNMGLASEWEMAAALGKQLNVPFITLSHYEIDPEVLQSIPEDIVKKYQIVPVDKTGNTLTIALSDPSNIYLLDEIRILTKCQIVPVISFESDIDEAINKYYDNGNESKFEEMLKDITDPEQDTEMEILNQDEIDDNDDTSLEANDAPVIQLVNLIIKEAIKMRASDIHIEPYEKELRIRYRIDGVLHEISPPPKKFQNAITARIKVLSNMKLDEKRLPQDNRFKLKVDTKSIDFRVSTCPTSFGEKIVMRILDHSSLMLNLEDLGFETHILKKFNDQIHKPWGMILVTGPTGSGKSTTLYSALSTINDPRKNISTIEDPVEYQLRGINQVQARPEIGLTFAGGLKSFLRQDPDVIMVGEIRDFETAEVAIKAALTGHLVLSTLHTNDAPSSINRLTNMGIEAFLVTASINLIMAQRLVRRICENCKDDFTPPPELVSAMNFDKRDDIKYYKGYGCERCNNSGYRGRVALYEVMVVSNKMKDFILTGASSTELKRFAIEEGMESLRMAGSRKIQEGLTTIEEVLGATVADD